MSRILRRWISTIVIFPLFILFPNHRDHHRLTHFIFFFIFSRGGLCKIRKMKGDKFLSQRAIRERKNFMPKLNDNRHSTNCEFSPFFLLPSSWTRLWKISLDSHTLSLSLLLTHFRDEKQRRFSIFQREEKSFVIVRFFEVGMINTEMKIFQHTIYSRHNHPQLFSRSHLIFAHFQDALRHHAEKNNNNDRDDDDVFIHSIFSLSLSLSSQMRKFFIVENSQ